MNDPHALDLGDALTVLQVALALGLPVPVPDGAVVFEALVMPDGGGRLPIGKHRSLGVFASREAALETVYAFMVNMFDVRFGHPYGAPWVLSRAEVLAELRAGRESLGSLDANMAAGRLRTDRLRARLDAERAVWEAEFPGVEERLNAVEDGKWWRVRSKRVQAAPADPTPW